MQTVYNLQIIWLIKLFQEYPLSGTRWLQYSNLIEFQQTIRCNLFTTYRLINLESLSRRFQEVFSIRDLYRAPSYFST